MSRPSAVPLTGTKPYLTAANWATARETVPLEPTKLQSRLAAELSPPKRPRGAARRSSKTATGLEKADVIKTTVQSKSTILTVNLRHYTEPCSHDVQLSRDGRGDGKWGCNLGNRQKSLCCDAPSGVIPYTPVPLDSLFPEVPPEDSAIKYDLQVLGAFGGSGAESTHDNVGNDPTFAPFGFVLVAGPKDAVSSISKRNNSYVEVVDCSGISSLGGQSVRIFCANDGEGSNCDDMLEGGLEGTVLRMPDNCGPATYVVAESLTASQDQSLPGHLVKRKPVAKQVMDLKFHYDFKRVKRSDEKIYMRVDWS